MQITEIIGVCHDLAGGSLLPKELDYHSATLHVINTLDSMMQELGVSGKSMRQIKEDVTFLADVQSTEITTASLQSEIKYVRYRENDNSRWEILDIVDDIQELTDYENDGRWAVTFIGNLPKVNYHLSFKPSKDINAEVWGNQIGTTVTDITSLPEFTDNFSLLCGYRAADFLLDELLLFDGKKNYAPFVNSRKQTIGRKSLSLEKIWEIYKMNPADANSTDTVEPYSAIDDYLSDDDNSGYLNIIPPN